MDSNQFFGVNAMVVEDTEGQQISVTLHRWTGSIVNGSLEKEAERRTFPRAYALNILEAIGLSDMERVGKLFRNPEYSTEE